MFRSHYIAIAATIAILSIFSPVISFASSPLCRAGFEALYGARARAEPGAAVTFEQLPVGASPRDLIELFDAFQNGLVPDLRDPEQALAFEIYRKLKFGDPSTGLKAETDQRAIEFLVNNPVASKHAFNDVEIESATYHYPIGETPKLRAYVSSQLQNIGPIRSNLLEIVKNHGFWTKRLGLPPLKVEGTPTREQIVAHLSAAIPESVIRTMENGKVSTQDRLKGLYEHLKSLRETAIKNGQDPQAISQLMVDTVHIHAHEDALVKGGLASTDANLVYQSLKRVLDKRNDFAEQQGFEHGWKTFLQKMAVARPTKIPPDDQIAADLKRLRLEVENTKIKIPGSEKKWISRLLSVGESGYRSCLGGSDCSSNTYLTKAFDPNFLYFTRTDTDTKFSSGHVTVVLGTAANGQKVAYIDKVQNIPNNELAERIEAVRKSTLEKGYVLVAPIALDRVPSGFSNDADLRAYFHSLLLGYSKSNSNLGAFTPHSHDIKTDENYSSARMGLAVKPILPLEDAEAKIQTTDHSAAPWRTLHIDIAKMAHVVEDLKNGDDKAKIRYLDMAPILEKFSKMPKLAAKGVKADPAFEATIIRWSLEAGLDWSVKRKAIELLLERSEVEDLKYALEKLPVTQRQSLIQNWFQTDRWRDKTLRALGNSLFTYVKGNVGLMKKLVDQGLFNEEFWDWADGYPDVINHLVLNRAGQADVEKFILNAPSQMPEARFGQFENWALAKFPALQSSSVLELARWGRTHGKETLSPKLVAPLAWQDATQYKEQLAALEVMLNSGQVSGLDRLAKLPVMERGQILGDLFEKGNGKADSSGIYWQDGRLNLGNAHSRQSKKFFDALLNEPSVYEIPGFSDVLMMTFRLTQSPHSRPYSIALLKNLPREYGVPNIKTEALTILRIYGSHFQLETIDAHDLAIKDWNHEITQAYLASTSSVQSLKERFGPQVMQAYLEPAVKSALERITSGGHFGETEWKELIDLRVIVGHLNADLSIQARSDLFSLFKFALDRSSDPKVKLKAISYLALLDTPKALAHFARYPTKARDEIIETAFPVTWHGITPPTTIAPRKFAPEKDYLEIPDGAWPVFLNDKTWWTSKPAVDLLSHHLSRSSDIHRLLDGIANLPEMKKVMTPENYQSISQTLMRRYADINPGHRLAWLERVQDWNSLEAAAMTLELLKVSDLDTTQAIATKFGPRLIHNTFPEAEKVRAKLKSPKAKIASRTPLTPTKEMQNLIQENLGKTSENTGQPKQWFELKPDGNDSLQPLVTETVLAIGGKPVKVKVENGKIQTEPANALGVPNDYFKDQVIIGMQRRTDDGLFVLSLSNHSLRPQYLWLATQQSTKPSPKPSLKQTLIAKVFRTKPTQEIEYFLDATKIEEGDAVAAPIIRVHPETGFVVEFDAMRNQTKILSAGTAFNQSESGRTASFKMKPPKSLGANGGLQLKIQDLNGLDTEPHISLALSKEGKRVSDGLEPTEIWDTNSSSLVTASKGTVRWMDHGKEVSKRDLGWRETNSDDSKMVILPNGTVFALSPAEYSMKFEAAGLETKVKGLRATFHSPENTVTAKIPIEEFGGQTRLTPSKDGKGVFAMTHRRIYYFDAKTGEGWETIWDNKWDSNVLSIEETAPGKLRADCLMPSPAGSERVSLEIDIVDGVKIPLPPSN